MMRRPNGVKDFDVWSFFAAIPGERFPAAIRHRHFDFGHSKFGAEPDQPTKFSHIKGRRVDVLLRDLPVGLDADPVEALRAYLERRRTDSARALAAKAAVFVEPTELDRDDRMAEVRARRRQEPPGSCRYGDTTHAPRSGPSDGGPFATIASTSGLAHSGTNGQLSKSEPQERRSK